MQKDLLSVIERELVSCSKHTRITGELWLPVNKLAHMGVTPRGEGAGTRPREPTGAGGEQSLVPLSTLDLLDTHTTKGN